MHLQTEAVLTVLFRPIDGAEASLVSLIEMSGNSPICDKAVYEMRKNTKM